jgi:PDZ domain-containing protein
VSEPISDNQAPDGARGGARRGRSRGWSRRTWTLVLSVVLLAGFGLVGVLVPIPYVAIGPGPTFNVLGTVHGHPVIRVTGKRTDPTAGQLRMVTVSETSQISLFSGLGLWLSGRAALAPREEYFPPGTSRKQVRAKHAQMFKRSQSHAEVAALSLLGYPVDVVADRVVKGSPSAGKIAAGDELVAVAGRHLDTVAELQSVMKATEPGQRIPVVLRSDDGSTHTAHITLGSAPERSYGFLGIYPGLRADVPFDVAIKLKGIGGPSAGMMFALGVLDKLTPGHLDGGRVVAGTGTITDTGQVGRIGGIPFKMAAAKRDGAAVFLVPAGNCAEAAAHRPEGLRLVKVDTLHGAVAELRDLKAGKPVPGCS